MDKRLFHGLPELEAVAHVEQASIGRRAVLKAAAALALGAALSPLRASPSPLVFDAPGPTLEPAAGHPATAAQPALQLGEIPADFWERPRELWLQRQGTREAVQAVYWKDGAILPEGYWQLCAVLRDVRANRMTTMDPTILDVLRGVLGYYQAWRWPYPIVVTSGFRTVQTNNALKSEGAAKNSMHLYGRAADVYMPGASVRDIGLLGMHMQRGGVGFYPSKGFTHLDTGRLRAWKG